MEQQQARIIRDKLTTPLDAKASLKNAELFLKGGYQQAGYGAPDGSAIDGSHALKGNQGYYADFGKEVFLENVAKLKEFFKKRSLRLGKPIKYVIKTGIGGQHTPFQGIASVFELTNKRAAKITGEYELGKDFDRSIENDLRRLKIDWEQVALIPSSKSGSTDETMLVFVQIFALLLEKVADIKGVDGKKFAVVVLDVLHKINFIEGKERKNDDLFKGFSLSLVVETAQKEGFSLSLTKVKEIFSVVLGNMFFETTDRPSASRLSAFIRNSGLDRELGEDAPGFGAMFDNVGGRWTADLHMMTFLAYYGLDADKYWQLRFENIQGMHSEIHLASELGHRIVNANTSDIALLLPDCLYWFGKSIEQNFNESIWQEGFVNLIAVRESDWKNQKNYYSKSNRKLVINLSDLKLKSYLFNSFSIRITDLKKLKKQELAETFAKLFSIFYGMTNTVGCRLIARAVHVAGFKVEDADLNDLDNPATRIIQENLFLRQPYVELGKGLLEKRLKELQEKASGDAQAIIKAGAQICEKAQAMELKTNIAELLPLATINDQAGLIRFVAALRKFAVQDKRKLIPFIYLEGDKFITLRDYLIKRGVEWVMQGTSDQHISYQQVLAQPSRYLPLIISFVPKTISFGQPAIGFVKGYLHNIHPALVRDYFAEASFTALTDLRQKGGGLGVFLRLLDNRENAKMIRQAFSASSRPQSFRDS